MSDNLVIGDDGYAWPEIVGEQFRGGTPGANTLTPVLGADDAMHLIGELSARSPAFKSYLDKRAAASATAIRKQPRLQAQDWNIDFGPVSGAASTQTTIAVQPQCIFRCEKIMATDDYGQVGFSTPQPGLNGYGTSIGQILIGQRNQRPASTFTLTTFFASNSLGNGVKLNTCKEALSISMQISFVYACTFRATMFGKAIA